MKKLPRWLYYTLPCCLIFLGIILNSYAAIQLSKQKQPSLSSIVEPNIFSSSEIQQPLPTLPISSETSSIEASQEEPFLGHFPYLERNSDDMMIVASYAQGENQRFERLVSEAALALLKLIYAARDEGVWIVPVSGFRSVAKQEELFRAQIQRLGSAEAAAKISAPPGYSEHHTGYTVDLADGNFPKLDVTEDFTGTEAFIWLARHAQEFGFEMSFPENNPQGVSYEPWHWRFFGSPDAQAIFSAGRQ